MASLEVFLGTRGQTQVTSNSLVHTGAGETHARCYGKGEPTTGFGRHEGEGVGAVGWVPKLAATSLPPGGG